MIKTYLLSMLCLLPFLLTAQDWKTYPYEPAGSKVHFPADEGRHSAEPEEWWYTTGHVTGETTGKHYSYMLTYFYHPELIFDGFRVLNISDDDAGNFIEETAAVNYSVLSGDSLNILASIWQDGTESWKNKTGGDGKAIPFEYLISAGGAPGSLDLDYVSQKRPLILADSGFLYQGYTDYTYYYSLTGIDVTGTLTFDGITEQVTGTAWIDRQYGTINPSTGNRYEWFSIQLSNGMDLNIWNIFTSERKIPEGIKFNILAVYKDENTQYTTSLFEIERLGYAWMEDKGMCYARKWRLTSEEDNLDLVISTLHPGYEVELPFRFYEGPTTVTGTVNGEDVTGQGFAELLHSYEHPDVELVNNIAWNPSIPLKWQLHNPDDGRPVKYSLEYSTDMNEYLPLAENLEDTFYTWISPPLVDEQEFSLKLKAYSADSSLYGENIQQLSYNDPGTYNTEIYPAGPRVFPNPAGETLVVNGEGLESIRIFDLNGRLVYSSPAQNNSHRVDVSGLENGVYVLSVLTANGEYLERVVVSREIP